MKEYSLVFLNRGLKFSRDNDLKQAQDVINEYVSNGWKLQQIVSPNDIGGAMIGLFYKEQD